MLFSRNACQRLEPVGIMGRAVFYSPVLHGLRHNVRGCKGKLPALVHDLLHLFIYILGKTLSHSAQVEYVFAENCFNVQNFAHFILHSAAANYGFLSKFSRPQSRRHPASVMYAFPDGNRLSTFGKKQSCAVAITPRLPRIFCCPYHKVPAARVFSTYIITTFLYLHQKN